MNMPTGKTKKPTLAERVVDEMTIRGTTQSALAAATGISQGHLSKILRGGRAPGPKATKALRAWLAGRPLDQDAEEVRRLVGRLSGRNDHRLRHVADLLAAIEKLLG